MPKTKKLKLTPAQAAIFKAFMRARDRNGTHQCAYSKWPGTATVLKGCIRAGAIRDDAVRKDVLAARPTAAGAQWAWLVG